MALKLSLVIPSYNEATNLTELCQKIIKVLDSIAFDFEIIIVDDDSPDLTWMVAEGLAMQEARIKVIRRQRTRRGLASAVVSGWKASQGEILGVMDADLQHPAESLKSMLDQIINHPEVDIVVASRYAAGGSSLNRNFWQVTRSRLAIFLGMIFLPSIFKSIKDPMSGYFIMRKEVIAENKLRPMGYKILLEVLVMGSYKKVCELPYHFAVRYRGQTKAGWQQYAISLLQMIKLMVTR